MSRYSRTPTQAPAPSTDTALNGLASIAGAIPTTESLARLLLEKRLLAGVKVNGEWRSTKAAVEAARATAAGHAGRLPGAPHGYPIKSSLA